MFSVALGSISLILFLILVSLMASTVTAKSASLAINETRITNNASDQYYPNIYEDRIVWFGFLNENWAIYLYNISTSTKTPISINGTSPYAPVFCGDRIIWGNSIGINVDPVGYLLPVIYMYNLSTSKETQIATSKSMQTYPAIFGDNIVWIDSRNGNEEIYVCNLTTFKETPVSNVSWQYAHPSIYGNRIVWIRK